MAKLAMSHGVIDIEYRSLTVYVLVQ